MFTALNECVLRVAKRFEFVAMVDVDEFLLPKQGQLNLVDFLHKLDPHKKVRIIFTLYYSVSSLL